MTSVCSSLRDTAENHMAVRGKDCLYVFLQIHHCICACVENDNSALELKTVNEMFVEQGLKVYENFRNAKVSPRQISDRWAIALAIYCKRPHSYISVLPRMAIAHILDDLPDSLFQTAVDQAAYAKVFGIIFSCLRRVLHEHVDKSYVEFVLTNTVSRGVVYALRRKAWNNVQERQQLVESIGKLWRRGS